MSSSSPEMSKETKEMLSCWEVVEGMYFPPPMPGQVPWKDHISNVRQMKLRADDIIICAYPKTGSHWLWQVVSMLLQGKAEYDSCVKEQLMIDFINVDQLDQIPSPRVLNTHFRFSMLPVSEVKAKKVKVLHLYRNPKDALVSFYHMGKRWPDIGVREFQPFFEVFFSEKALGGNYFDYLKQMDEFARNNPDVTLMTLSYEDMKKCPVEKVKELAKFLGLEVSQTLCEEVVEACRFDNLKNHAARRKDPFNLGQSQHKVKSAEDGSKASTDEDIGGLAPMYRKGIVGDWKSYFTVAMNERVDRLIKEKMEGLPYTLQFEQA